ncbi:hypothetical protein ABEX78_23670 [Priestia megaterium]
MQVFRVVTDPFGKVIEIVEEGNGLFSYIGYLISAVIGMVISGLIIAIAMDKIYEHRSGIINMFIVVTLLIALLGRIKQIGYAKFLLFFYYLFISPLFVLVLYTGITYETETFDHINTYSLSDSAPFLFYLFLAPVVCLYVGAVIGNILKLIAGIPKEKKLYS